MKYKLTDIKDRISQLKNLNYQANKEYCIALFERNISEPFPDWLELFTIPSHAFAGCNNLINITIPDSVTTIGNYAFQDCRNLESVTFSANVITASQTIVSGCFNLQRIIVNENNQNFSSDESGVWFDKNKTTLIQYPMGNTRTAYTIPDGVTTIGTDAFLACNSLTEVTIPDSVTTIGGWAFYYCYVLSDMYMYPTTPPTLYATDSIPGTTTIHVPIGSGEAYRTATNWSSLADKIVEDIEI